MTSANDEQIKASLAFAHQLKTNVDQTAQEFKDLRKKLLQNLGILKLAQVGILIISTEI
jgi:hypothetical protein